MIPNTFPVNLRKLRAAELTVLLEYLNDVKIFKKNILTLPRVHRALNVIANDEFIGFFKIFLKRFENVFLCIFVPRSPNIWCFFADFLIYFWKFREYVFS